MQSIPPSTSVSFDPPNGESPFVFPDERSTSSQAAAEDKKQQEQQESEGNKKHRQSRHRSHRPHLHIPFAQQTTKQSPPTLKQIESPTTTRNPTTNGNTTANNENVRPEAGASGTYLTVPKTSSPHARSLDSQSRPHFKSINTIPNANGHEQCKRQQEQGEIDSTSSATSYSPSGGGELSDTTSTINPVKDVSEDHLPPAYDFPTTPATAAVGPARPLANHKDSNDVIANVGEKKSDGSAGSAAQPVDGGEQNGRKTSGRGKKSSSVVVSLSVWDQIKLERDNQPGVDPSKIHSRLSTLASQTRAHTLKLSTLQRTIEHRMAEWQVLGDRMDEISRSAEVIGRELVGKREWGKRVTVVPAKGSVGMENQLKEEPHEMDTRRATSPTRNPLTTLHSLTQRTTISRQSLEQLSTAVHQRETDLQRYRGKVERDAVELHGRMVGSLGRKMRGIEDAQREARRRDLIINIITFTVLLIAGIFFSRMVVKISTCESWRMAMAQLGRLLRSGVRGGR